MPELPTSPEPIAAATPAGGRWRLATFMLLGLFAFVIVRKAWVCDDAYITFRTIDNFVHGYGLRYNIAERVQVFTHPLWMALVTLPYLLTREPYYTSLALSLALSLIVAALVPFRLAAAPGAGASGLAALLLSRAFTDYATSGLENPLAHLLLALFMLIGLRAPDPSRMSRRDATRLVLIAALLGTTRLDLLLLVLPALALTLPARPLRAALRPLLLGSLPLVVWEIFSLFYYGFPFPNTAYAKLGTGIPASEMFGRGLDYLINSARVDPLTLAVIAAAVTVAGLRRGRPGLPFAAGIIVYLTYVTVIGGDFMSGRFLTAPFLVSVGLLAGQPLPRRVVWTTAAAVVLVTLALFVAEIVRWSRITPAALAAARDNPALDDRGIADERRVYESAASLVRAPRRGIWPNPRAAEQAAEARKDWMSHTWLPQLQGFGIADRGEAGPLDIERDASDPPLDPVVARGSIGCFGFYLGPGVHLLDFQALADPLLARLPVMERDPMLPVLTPRLARLKWRTGHFPRRIPAGYFETLMTGDNRIREPEIAEYYDALSLITRGDLWDGKRLVAIGRMTLGSYDRLLAASRAASTRGGKGQAWANSSRVIQAKASCSSDRITSPDAEVPR